jgi:hypothetical protein
MLAAPRPPKMPRGAERRIVYGCAVIQDLDAFANAFKDRNLELPRIVRGTAAIQTAPQAKRMEALTDAALSAKERMKTGDYPYPDDDIVIIPSGGVRRTVFSLDNDLHGRRQLGSYFFAHHPG